MPDHMAKRISESINQRCITPEDALQDALDELAKVLPGLKQFKIIDISHFLP
jgi:hypothetical protein